MCLWVGVAGPGEASRSSMQHGEGQPTLAQVSAQELLERQQLMRRQAELLKRQGLTLARVHRHARASTPPLHQRTGQPCSQLPEQLHEAPLPQFHRHPHPAAAPSAHNSAHAAVVSQHSGSQMWTSAASRRVSPAALQAYASARPGSPAALSPFAAAQLTEPHAHKLTARAVAPSLAQLAAQQHQQGVAPPCEVAAAQLQASAELLRALAERRAQPRRPRAAAPRNNTARQRPPPLEDTEAAWAGALNPGRQAATARLSRNPAPHSCSDLPRSVEPQRHLLPWAAHQQLRCHAPPPPLPATSSCHPASRLQSRISAAAVRPTSRAAPSVLPHDRACGRATSDTEEACKAIVDAERKLLRALNIPPSAGVPTPSPQPPLPRCQRPPKRHHHRPSRLSRTPSPGSIPCSMGLALPPIAPKPPISPPLGGAGPIARQLAHRSFSTGSLVSVAATEKPLLPTLLSRSPGVKLPAAVAPASEQLPPQPAFPADAARRNALASAAAAPVPQSALLRLNSDRLNLISAPMARMFDIPSLAAGGQLRHVSTPPLPSLPGPTLARGGSLPTLHALHPQGPLPPLPAAPHDSLAYALQLQALAPPSMPVAPVHVPPLLHSLPYALEPTAQALQVQQAAVPGLVGAAQLPDLGLRVGVKRPASRLGREAPSSSLPMARSGQAKRPAKRRTASEGKPADSRPRRSWEAVLRGATAAPQQPPQQPPTKEAAAATTIQGENTGPMVPPSEG